MKIATVNAAHDLIDEHLPIRAGDLLEVWLCEPEPGDIILVGEYGRVAHYAGSMDNFLGVVMAVHRFRQTRH